MITTDPSLTLRRGDLASLAEVLKNQHARKLDLVAPAGSFWMTGGDLSVHGAEVVLEDDGSGVTDPNGVYRVLEGYDDGIADKLGIPRAYLRRMRSERPLLYDVNVNTWLSDDTRSFLLRLFTGEPTGLARAFLSDTYKVIDNFDVLTAALDGVSQAGVNARVASADLSERRMRVRVVCEEVAALAPELLKNYRSPFTGAFGADNPTVFAGFDIRNSETGGGAFVLVPVITVQICNNGAVMSKDALRAVHLGGKMDDGVIRWSDETQRKAADLVAARARDAAATFLDVDYVKAKIRELEEAAGVKVSDAPKTIKAVGKQLAYSEATVAGILEKFIEGADSTAGGVMHAVTAYAQTLDDPDAAIDLEETGVAAMHLAASAA